MQFSYKKTFTILSSLLIGTSLYSACVQSINVGNNDLNGTNSIEVNNLYAGTNGNITIYGGHVSLDANNTIFIGGNNISSIFAAIYQSFTSPKVENFDVTSQFTAATWLIADSTCRNLNINGLTGWVLPSLYVAQAFNEHNQSFSGADTYWLNTIHNTTVQLDVDEHTSGYRPFSYYNTIYTGLRGTTGYNGSGSNITTKAFKCVRFKM